MKQVMNYHKDNGLLNMIRRTDPMITKVYNLSPTISYIQNVTIGTDTDYEAGRVMVGTNVTNQVPTGNVVIQNCDVTISADETTLYPTTEVKAGASLTITNR